MPDTIERLIYKLELDDSGYLRGVESLSASTKKFTEQQEAANKVLQTNQLNLKNQSAYVQQTKKDLDVYTGTNEKYRLQLQKSFQTAVADEQKLTEKVLQNKKAYDEATAAAQNFANVSSRASNLQAQTTGGKIPTGPPPGISSQITQQISGVLNVAEFTETAQIIEQTKKEFDDLAISVGIAEERMRQLNETDEEFKQLAPIVAKGKEALQQYEKVAQGASTAQGSLRSQLRQGREELVKLEQAGKGATKQYFELEKQVARLTDQFGDQQQRIKILASDTKLLDFGKGAITAATSAFQAFTAVSILAGDESAELQKKTMQLFAAMQLLQSLEQLSNLTRREGVLATLAQSGAQSVYTAVVGTSTGALKAFRLALLGTGIGAAIVLIGFLVSKWSAYRDTVKKAAEQQKVLNDVIAEGNKEAGKQVADLKILTKAVQDSNIPMKERLEAVKQLQKEFPDYFGNLTKEAILTGDITTATRLATEAIIAASRARAAKGKIDALESEQLDLDFEKEKVLIESGKKLIEIRKQGTVTQDIGMGQSVKVTAEQREAAEKESLRRALADIKDKDETLERQEDFLIKFVGLDKIAKTVEDPADKEKKKTNKAVKEIENVYRAEKEKLDLRLAELNRKEADNESKIRVEFTQRLLSEQARIEKLLKEKKLTKPQAKDLKEEIAGINTIELDKALKDFNKKQTDARAKLNDDLQNLQNKNTQDTLNLLQDEFTRRASLIEFNEQKELETARENIVKRLAALELDHLLIGEKAYQDAKALLIAAGEQNALNIIQRFANERKDLSADLFQSLLNSYTTAIANSDLVFTENEAKAIRALADKFLAGKISYEKFQQDVTKIQKDADKDRQESALIVEQDKLSALDQELSKIEDKYSEHYKRLKKQRDEQAQKVAELQITNAKTDVEDPNKKQVETVQQYAEAIGQVVDSVVQFWQAANDAEAAALDRSISLQEKRVAAAQRIAERGNAQYLKAEEDRLTELNVKRENAARKQLGIDAALQASQILVGITGAIAKIATPGIGIAETIAAMAVIFGALAAGYGLVKSLQGNQPKLFKGTTDVKRDGHRAGVDTIPAWLTEHEAVIPTDKNKKYKKSVEAIYHGKVPADVMNNFVENYVKNRKEKTEKSDIIKTVHRVVNETSDKKISYSEVRDFISKGSKSTDEKIIGTLFNLVSNKLDKKETSLKSTEDLQKYFTAINKVFSQNKTLVESKNITELVQKVASELSIKNISSFIDSYVKDQKSSSVVEKVFKEVNSRIENKASKTNEYSEIINKVFSENKQLTESKNITALVHKVLNETKDISEVSSLIKNFQDNKTSDVIKTVTELVKNSIEKRKFSFDKLTNENISFQDVQKYSTVVDKVLNENKKAVDFNTVVHKVVNEVLDKKLSLKEFNSFSKDTRQTSSVIENIFNQVQNKIDNKQSETSIYSEAIDKVFSENKNLVESKNVSGIVKKILNETVDKNISLSQANSFVNDTRDKKTSNVIQTLVKLINEKSATEDFKKSLVNESVTIEDVHKFSEIIQKEKKLSIYKQFVQNVSKVPAQVLNSFIENYTERKFFKGTTDLQGKSGIDNIPIWASKHEAIIPVEKNNLYKPVIKAVFNGTIPPEQLNNFVNNYHSIKAVPQVNYTRIKEAAELKMGQDGRMSVAITEQNKLIVENNDLQRQTLRAMKSMAVSANIDKNGVAIMVNEYMEQMKIDTKT